MRQGRWPLRLDLSLGCTIMEVGSCVAALRGLTRLRLATQEDMSITRSLAGLTGLKDLELSVGRQDYSPIRMGPKVRLPTSLTRLVLACDNSQEMPRQVRRLAAAGWLAGCLHACMHACMPEWKSDLRIAAVPGVVSNQQGASIAMQCPLLCM